MVAHTIMGRYPGRWEVAFQEACTEGARFWRKIAHELVGDSHLEELHPVPSKPEIAPDVWITLEI